MTVAELIKRLQEVDPEGTREVTLGLDVDGSGLVDFALEAPKGRREVEVTSSPYRQMLTVDAHRPVQMASTAEQERPKPNKIETK